MALLLPASDAEAQQKRKEGYALHEESGRLFYMNVVEDSVVVIREGLDADGPTVSLPAEVARTILGHVNVVSPLDTLAARERFEVSLEDSFLTVNFVRRTGALIIAALFGLLFFGLVVFGVRNRRKYETEVERRKQLVEVQQRLTEGLEEERKRLAQELHDGPVQDLHAVHMMLAFAQESGGQTLEEGALGDELMNVVAELRAISENLRPPALGPFGLVAAVRGQAERIRKRYPNVEIDVTIDGAEVELPLSLTLPLFRIYQEALNNAVQHADPSQVKVDVAYTPKQVSIQVQDDGKGFDLPERWVDLGARGHYGMLGMSERTQIMNGSFHVNSALGEGTTLRILVPITDQAMQAGKKQANSPARGAFVSVLALLLLLVVAPTTLAQRVLTLDGAIDLAMERHPEIIQANEMARVTRAGVQASQGQFLPNLRFGATPQLGFGRQFDTTTGRLEDERVDRLNMSATASLNLFAGFGDVAGVRRARAERTAAGYGQEAAQISVAERTATQYMQVLLDRAAVQIRAENLAYQQQLLEQIQGLVEVGERADVDLYAQEAQVAQAELRLLEAEQAAELALAELAATLQLDPSEPIELIEPEHAGLLPKFDLDGLVAQALQDRPDVNQLRAQSDAALAGIRVAQARTMPRIDLISVASTAYVSTDDLQRSLGTQFGDNRYGSVYLQFSLPLFNRFETRYQTQQARAQFNTAQAELVSRRTEVSVRVRRAYLDAVSFGKRVDAASRQANAARRAFEAEEARYTLGGSTLVELTQARAALVQAEQDEAAARYGQHLAHLRLQLERGSIAG
ncbi:MAG: TolC family protein [Bacteroidota bacterium]